MGAHKDFRTSLVLFCQNQITAMLGANLSPEIVYLELDQHSQIDSFPSKDAIGMGNINWVNDGKFYSIRCSIAVSTYGDTSLFRHTDFVDFLEQKLRPNMTIDLIDANTGISHGYMVVTAGVSLMPMAASKDRTLQCFLVHFQTSRTSDLRPS